jgi:thiamine-phosphate pyrophosphorylase
MTLDPFKFPSRLYAIADDTASLLPLTEQISALLTAGVKVIQVRCKILADVELLAVLHDAVPRCAAAGALLIVNDRVDLCLKSGASGVHLGQADMPVEQAREKLGPHKIIGCSTHTPDEFSRGLTTSADYLALGPIFPTATKNVEHAHHGVTGLYKYVRQCNRPLVAIGGISRDSFPVVLATGVAAVAVIGAVWRQKNPTAAARALLIQAGEGPAAKPKD